LEKHRNAIHGMVHCSGGGQTKVLHFMDANRVVKDNLLPLPPLFQLIHQQSGTPLREMYKVFNMGHRLEMYTDAATAPALIALAQSFGIDAAIVGRVEASNHPEVVITGHDGALYTYAK
jgi:phosphoribosylformylglycinamidine cyclo-ligase